MASNFAFEGARFSFSKPVGQHMQLQHQLQLGKEPSYHFSPTYVGTLRQVSPQETFPVVMADMDHKGSLMTQVIHEFSRSFRTRFQVQTEQAEYKALQVEAEYSGSDFSLGAKAVNVDLLRGSGIWVVNYLQKITSKLALGGECMYQRGPGGEQAIPSFAGRYTGSSGWMATSTISPMGMLEASYFHEYSPRLQLATTLDVNLATAGAVASVGFQTAFKTAAVRGQVNTNGVVTSVYEKQLAPAVNLLISLVLDHVKGDNSVGVALQIGQ
jgi:mitochondrial import receptor subunit TOM40